ncbi:hypothetical protein BDY19DRAFT_983223 [Irpex rosettiformis]|uniref:Uncharacterized protein n=1 Tax=Irpex rosettiformis TaxID=378272 RepID=A0ACB8UE29_9APHY|nr:hypothetical protein BDY19DRAFT_983223 [Irpex rosettiformis]
MDFHFEVFRREPFPEEITAANAKIREQELAIKTADQEIQALMAQITLVRVTQSRYRETIARCKAVTTLARRLPEELLAKIFESCVVDGWTRAPVVVSHVCSRWRRAAMSPRVWSYIYVDGDSTDAVGRTRLWLSRAKEAPLHPTFIMTWRSARSHLWQNMELIAQRASQWETITMNSETVSQAWELINQCRLPMANLREIKAALEVQFHPVLDGEPELMDMARIFTIERAPQLHTVHLACNTLPLQLTLPPHLRSLVLTLTGSPNQRLSSASAFLDILESVPALEQLTISLPSLASQPYLAETDMDRSVVLQSLASLTLHGPTDLSGFLEHIHSPNLRQLRIRSNEEANLQQDPLAPTLFAFLKGSEAALELLELHDVDISHEFFPAYLAMLPSLRELRLHDSIITDTTLQCLDELCPLLTRIDLRWCGMVTGKALVNFVHRRNLKMNNVWHDEFMSIPGSFENEREPSLIEEVSVLNCSLVREEDVLELGRMTLCRVKVRDDDYCHTQGCCNNGRYRQRLRLRNMDAFMNQDGPRLRLIV